jgi:hypothetical protein
MIHLGGCLKTRLLGQTQRDLGSRGWQTSFLCDFGLWAKDGTYFRGKFVTNSWCSNARDILALVLTDSACWGWRGWRRSWGSYFAVGLSVPNIHAQAALYVWSASASDKKEDVSRIYCCRGLRARGLFCFVLVLEKVGSVGSGSASR